MRVTRDSRRRLLRVLALFLFLLLTSTGAPCEDLTDLLNRYAARGHHERIGSPLSGAVLVARDDQVILKEAYGFSELENRTPLTVESRFMIGSITKQFTAMLVMQQVEAGRIELAKTVSDYLPDYPESKGRKMTIHQLLSHSAGLPHYEGLRSLNIQRREFFDKQRTPEDLARLIARVEFVNEPGTEFHYSSLGYDLLGVILEAVTGRSFADLLRENIAEPLGLSNTGYADNEYVEKHVASGYLFREYELLERISALFSPRKGIYAEDGFRNQSSTYSTGGIHSTVEDLWKWSRAVRQSTILSPELTERMLTPNIGGYCYGWERNQESVIRRNPSVRLYSHGGGLEGFRSNIALYDDGTTIILLCNVVPVNTIRLTQNIHLTATGTAIKDFRRDLLRPEIEEDLTTFVEDGGMLAFREYYEEISRRAGYEVLPAEMAYVELIALYVKGRMEREADGIGAELFDRYSKPTEDTINRIGYVFLQNGFKAEAIDYFQRNVKRYPLSANVHDSLGEAYRANGQFQLALASCRKAVKVAQVTSAPGLELMEENLESIEKECRAREDD